MIRIISGWSNPGGSTIAFIRLCNLFNDNGIPCVFYGPHSWHLTQLEEGRAGTLSQFPVMNIKNSILISHFFPPQDFKSLKPKKHILSCHETNLYKVKNLIDNNPKEKFWDYIHFVSKFQKDWHDVDWKKTEIQPVVIPNVLPKLKKAPLNTNCAGIIGSIDAHKRTHIALEKAIKEPFTKIFLYGKITDSQYFKEKIVQLLDDRVVVDYCEDIQKMYDSIDVVYHASSRETFNYVKAECSLTGVKFISLEQVTPVIEYWEDAKILSSWKEIL